MMGREGLSAIGIGAYLRRSAKYMAPPSVLLFYLMRNAGATTAGLQIISQLDYVKGVLSQVGPILSAVLFVVAGVFYALGQVMPPDKRANFHTTAINIIIGAIVVGVLSVASTSLALASSHLLNNVTSNSLA